MEETPNNLAGNLAGGAETAQVWQPDLSESGEIIAPTIPSRPLWLSTIAYLFVAMATSLSLFFILWIVIHDNGEREAPWIPAGIVASLMMFVALVAREVVLRRAQTRYLLKKDGFGHPVHHPPQHRAKPKVKSKKFTLEHNAAALRLIQRKSDEAESSVATSEKHLEVFKACQEYLEIVESELLKVHLSSPRLPALRNGLEGVKTLHKHHLLHWAAEETRRLIREAGASMTLDEKTETANRAIEALNFALQYYPEEAQLTESLVAVREFIASVRIAEWIENAERAAFKGNYRQAIDHYQDALFNIQREPALNDEERELTSNRLNIEIEKLRSILRDKKKKKQSRKRLPPRT